MKIDLTNMNGIRCLTESKYCCENIDIVPTLQNKTVAPAPTAQTVKPDDGYAGLGTVEVTAATRTAIKAIDLSYGDQSVTYSSSEGIGLTGAGKVTYADDTADDIIKDLEVPLVAKEGLKADASADNKKVEIKIDPAHSVYMATTPTATSAVPIKNGNAWSGIAATPSASASSVVTRDANGRAQFGTPAFAGDAATKAYVDGEIPTIGKISDTAPGNLKSISYCANTDLPATPDANTEYALTDFISYGDLDSDLQSRIDTTGALTGTIVNISAPENATNGTLTENELASLQASDNASIMLDHKKYYLEGKGHQEGYLTYTHSGYENNVHILESVTITISTRAWVLNTSDVYNMVKLTQAAYNSLETKDANTLYLIVG